MNWQESRILCRWLDQTLIPGDDTESMKTSNLTERLVTKYAIIERSRGWTGRPILRRVTDS